MYYQDEINFLVFLIVVLSVFFGYRFYKKTQDESNRNALLDEYSKYSELIINFNKSFQSLKVSQVHQVIRTLEVVNPKYELMIPLVNYKNRIQDWEIVIKDLKLLNNVHIRKNVNIILKRFKLIDKYGEDIGNKLASYNFFVGMTEQMLIETKGEPLKIERFGVLDSKKVLTYIKNTSEDSFTFVEGKLIQILQSSLFFLSNKYRSKRKLLYFYQCCLKLVLKDYN